MGLDMYLSAERFLWRGMESEEDFSSHDIEGCEIKEVTYDVGYWRKANHIHKWFVDNVQNGVDDCGSYYVSLDTLNVLKDSCVAVLDIIGNAEPTEEYERLAGYTPTKECAMGVFDGCRLEESHDGGFTAYETCKRYSDDIVRKCMDVLPTSEGFFFGGTEIDCYYIQDTKETIEIVDRAFRLKAKVNGIDFKYQSSW